MGMIRIILPPFFLGLLASFAPGQEVLRTYTDLWTGGVVAAPLSAMEDVDGDGLREFLLGDSNLEPYGEVRILAGSTGELISMVAVREFRLGAHVVGLADVTGDGIADFMAAGDFGGGGHVWSGATYERVWSGERFDSGASIGDIDGDGIGDYVLAGYELPRAAGSGTVYYGGRHEPAYDLSLPGSINYGHAAVALGDVDGDGIGDFAIGAPGPIFNESCSAGEVYVHSGVDGHLVYRLEGDGVNSLFGEYVAAPGDVNGDGIGDLAVGAELCCALECDQAGAGRVSFFDGPTGRLLEHVPPEPLGTFRLGGKLVGVGDLDGNGYGDVLTQAIVQFGPNFFTGALFALDGASRQLIYQVWSEEAALHCGYGTQIVPAGDVNGDDFPDYYVSTACARTEPEDRIDVISGAPIGVRALGGRCGEIARGRPLRIGATGVPEIGRTYPIHLSGVEPGADARLLLGDLRPFSLPGAVRAGQCGAAVLPSEIQRVLAKQVRPGEGVATAMIPIPNSSHLIGMKFHAQWMVGPGRWSTSRVLEIEIQPSDPLRGR